MTLHFPITIGQPATSQFLRLAEKTSSIYQHSFPFYEPAASGYEKLCEAKGRIALALDYFRTAHNKLRGFPSSGSQATPMPIQTYRLPSGGIYIGATPPEAATPLY